MDESAEICIQHNGTEKCFPFTFRKWGYSYRITVVVFDTEVIFEPDEERNFRGRIESPGKIPHQLAELVPLIGEALQKQLG